MDERYFNRDLYDFAHLPEKRRAALASSVQATFAGSESQSVMDDDAEIVPLGAVQGPKTGRLDERFFARGQGNGQLKKPFHHKYSEQVAAGKQLTGRKAREMLALEKDVDPSELKLNSKKHFKANKRKAKAKISTEFD